MRLRGADVRGYGDAANPWVTVEDTLVGITNPAAAAQLAVQAQTPQTIVGPPPNYTPILVGGAVVVLAALYLKRSKI